MTADERVLQEPPGAQFYRKLMQLTPVAWVTRIFVLLNVGVFLLMAVRGVNVLNPQSDALLAWGANYGPLTLDGESWRLLTSTFLHIGIMHLVMNMWVIYYVGTLVERMTGSVGYALSYLTSGLAGSMASMMWSPDHLSAGASGAGFGLFGMLLGFLVLRRHSSEWQLASSLMQRVGMVLVLNLIFGFSVPGIDNAAHLGGLACGFFCGLGLSQSAEQMTHRSRALRALLVGLAASILLALGLYLLPPAPGDVVGTLAEFSAVEKSVVKIYNTAAGRHDAKELRDEQFASILESEVLPPWRRMESRMENLENLTQDSRQQIDQLLHYVQLRGQSWQLLAESLRDHDPRKSRQHRETWEQAEAALDAINKAR